MERRPVRAAREVPPHASVTTSRAQWSPAPAEADATATETLVLVRELVAIAEAIGDRPFTSAQLMTHADAADPALRAALTAADITSAQEAGCVFRRLEGITLAGVRLERAGAPRAGILWRVQVQVCED